MKNFLLKALVVALTVFALPSMAADVALKKISTGVRQKGFFNINVYKASLLVAKDGPVINLESLLAMPAFALELEFLRDVKATDLVKGFQSALKANNIAESQAFNKLIAILKSRGQIKKDQKVTFFADRDAKILTCQQDGITLISLTADDTFLREIFSMWLGNPADSGLAKLKKSLLAPLTLTQGG